MLRIQNSIRLMPCVSFWHQEFSVHKQIQAIYLWTEAQLKKILYVVSSA